MTSIRENDEAKQVRLEQLMVQHQGHEHRLEELRRKPRLTPEEEVEEKTLKKLKLNVKDQIALLRRSAS